MRKTILLAAASLMASWSATTAFGFDIFQPGDPIVAIDLDVAIGSSSPANGNENVPNILDNNSGSKYLNFGITRTGFIVTPSTTAALQSFVITTANDATERDPINYEVYGTNSPITSVAHGRGDSEPWTLISSGPVTLPLERETVGSPVDFTNATAYSSYKVIFPEVRNIRDGAPFNANSMQIADVSFFTGMGGTGTSMLSPTDFIIPVRDFEGPTSAYPAAEGPVNAIDRVVGSKYLNFGEANSGVIVTPSNTSAIPKGIRITTANDFEGRDPVSYALYGTNEEITTPDNGIGNEQNWTLISEGTIDAPFDRFTRSDVSEFTNNQAYSSYRIVFPTVREPGVGAMQIAEVQLVADDVATLLVNRQTGEVTLRAEETITFSGYEVASLSTNGLDASGWNTITGTNTDPNDTWGVTSSPGAADLLSEEDLPSGANDGLTLTAGNTLSLGSLWQLLPSSYEDVGFSLFDLNGNLIADAVEYVGTEIVLGDYSGNGTVGPEDWPMFRAGLGGNYDGMSLSEAYLGGDLDGDFDSDIFDFNLFLELAGGPAALFGTTQVPEPSTVVLVVGAILGGMGLRSRRRLARLATVACVALIAITFQGLASAQSFTNVGGVPVGITTPDPIENDQSGPANWFDDDFLEDSPSTIDGELFLLDYNDPNLAGEYAQYAGMGADPKTVFLDYGSPVTANWFAYAQRSGSDPTADRVGMFELWFSNTPFNDVLPASPPDAVVKLDPDDDRLQDSALRPYTLQGNKTGQYVAVRLTVSELSANQPVNNIGGHEFRLLSGPSDVVLEVNRATGEMTLRNTGPNAQSIELQSYSIDSPSGGLDASGFDGVAGASGFPAGTGSGNGWEIGGGSNASRLIEANFQNSSFLAPGASISLGEGYNPLSLAEDLSIRWTSNFIFSGTSGSRLVTEVYDGVVNYIGTAPDILPGDYNGDDVVDAADYTVWRNNLGTTNTLPNDSTPGSVDIDDYNRWKLNFGNTATGSLAVSTSAVPEPHSIVLSLLFTVVGATAIRRTKVFGSR